tara:strand:- start:1872 stop:2147 length:276 start_codon:yes stop_codon:yes gene_type:complete
MATQEREIVDLLWDGGQDASALGKLKDMLQVKAAAAVDASKLDIANKMFPHVPDDGATGLPPEGEASPEETADVLNRNDDTEKENNDETDN